MDDEKANTTEQDDMNRSNAEIEDKNDVFNENIEFKHEKTTSWPGPTTLAAFGKFQFRKKKSSLYEGSLHLQLANGELMFSKGKNNLHIAKYTYVPTGTNSISVLNYLLETANLKLPMLVFSIPHMSQRVPHKPNRLMKIYHGIIQTAINMNAWILTCGTENSVPNQVSLKLKEHIIKYETKPVTIGIVPTSYISDDVDVAIAGKAVTYNAVTGDQLDSTHSHFIMVAPDTNSENSEKTVKRKLEKILAKGGKNLAKIRQSINTMNDLEALSNQKLRHQSIGSVPGNIIKLKKEMNGTLDKSLPSLDGSVSSNMTTVEKIDRQNPIPVVVVVVGGDVESVVKLTEDLEYKKDTSTIFLVFEGSGGAADLLALVVRTANEFGETSEEFRNQIRVRLKSFMFSQVRRESSRFMINKDDLFHCTQRFAALRRKVHVCNCKSLRSEKLEKRIRQEILVALLEKVETQPREKLLIALVWNEPDAIRNTLFDRNKNYKINDQDLYYVMTMALERGNVEFVKLLVDNGVSMEQFLTMERLEYLYNSCSTKTTPTFKDLLTLSKTLLVEGKIKFIKLRHVDSVIKFLMGGEFDNRYGRYALEDSATIPHAFSELFLMAVLCQRFSLAEYFWQHGTHPIIKALVAMKIYSKLGDIAHDRLDIETSSTLKSESEKYSEYAFDLLDISYDMHQKQAKKITIRRHENWSRYSCLSLAVKASHMKFVAHKCCQAHLNDIWVGKLLTRKVYEVLLCCIFPPFLFLIKYKSNEKILSGENEGTFSKERENTSMKAVLKSRMKKVNYFYTAPMVKFWMNVVSYLLFLLAFSYVVLKKLETVPSFFEFFVIIYILSLTIEELRQMFSGKFRHWLADYWNIWDFLAIMCFVVGFALRWAVNTVSIAKVLYAVDVCLWYIRLLDLFSVNSYLGTYVTMIGKMTYDTARFLCIMLIFTVGYGVAREGILEPEVPDISMTDKLISVLHVPYWQIYGELFLEDLQCGSSDPNDPSTPCVPGHFVVDVMTGLYLLIGNILLLNMLIAIFNNIFTEYQENAEVIWKFERHRLVTEYMKRPVLVPPFMIFAHLWRLYKWTNRERRKIVPKIFKKDATEEVADDDTKLLDHWEEEIIKVYVNKKTVSKEQSTEHMMGELSERILTMSTRLGEIDRRLQQLDEIDAKLDTNLRGMTVDENNVSAQLNTLDCKFNTLLYESEKQKERLANVQWAILKLKKSCGRPVERVRRKSTSALFATDQPSSQPP